MSNVITNLKVRFGADTSKFKKGMDQGQKSVKEFKQKGSSAFNEFAQAFGVNVDAITNHTRTFTAGLGAMNAGMKGAASGSGFLTKALKLLKVAMVSTGIGALVVALGSLISYFTKTKKGADTVSRVMDAIGAVFSVIVDRASALGESIVKAFTNPKKAVLDLWNFIKSQFVNRFTGLINMVQSAYKIVTGLFDGTAKDAARDFTTALNQTITGLDETQQKKVGDGFRNLGKEIANEAKAAADLRGQLQKLEDQEIKLIEVNSERQKQIERLRAKSKELRDKDIEGSRRALRQAMNIEQARLDDELRIARERAKIIEQQKALGNNLREDDRELAEAKAKVNQLETQSLKLRRTLVSEMNSLNREYEREAKAMRETEMAVYSQIEALGKLQGAGGGSVDIGGIDTSKLAPIPAMDTTLLQESAGEVRAIFDNIGEIANGTMSTLVTGFAESFGSMMAGAGGLQNFGNFVLGTLADMAINVGKMAISTGIAVAGIKKALMSLNPAVAIAAGAALVAIGTAVKGSLQSAATGASSGGSISAAGSTGSGGTTTIDARGNNTRSEQSIKIHLTGEFKQKGKDLVAVVNEENYRKNIRT